MIKFEFPNYYQAKQDIIEYAVHLADKMRVLLERLGSEGYDIADAGFRNARYAGHNDVKMELPRIEDNTLYITAYGNSVAFIEFGTGTFYEEYPITVQGVDARGTYGKHMGSRPPWKYEGDAGNLGVVIRHRSNGKDLVETYGNPPARAMYNASKVFDQDHVVQIAKEVFGK